MPSKPVRTIFAGSSFEGISILKSLIEDPLINVTAVITQPDRPVGRKHELTPTPVKVVAQEHRLKVYTPQKDRTVYQKILDDQKPELIIVVAFGDILPEFVLNFPRYKCLNVHYSLLPRLRGAVPVQKAILEGHRSTGVTIQVMEASLDTGSVIIQEEIPIDPHDTTITLKEKLIPIGVDLIQKIIHPWINGEVALQQQDHTKATYCYQDDISKQKAQIEWQNTTPVRIVRMVRALVPWPVAWTTINSKRVKIFEAEIVDCNKVLDAGTPFVLDNNLLVATIDPGKAVRLITVQPEGKSKMSGEDLARGLRNAENRKEADQVFHKPDSV